MEELELIERPYLTNGSRGKKLIDMPYVYSQLDKGRPLWEIAEELQVSRSTIYRRHKEYQAMVKATKAVDDTAEQIYKGELPPLPEGI